MATFFSNILQAHFALTFVAFLITLNSGYVGYLNRAQGGFHGIIWAIWYLASVLCLVVCVKLAFGI